MSDIKHCAECGAALPAYWPKGLCAQCALEGALDMTNAESQVHQPKTLTITPADLTPPGSSAESSPLGSFGDYELLEEIARGGMGVVYRARQRNLGRIVAVKMILAGSLAGKEFVQRFRTEAAAAAILQHPNIVAIHDVGVHEGRHYFSMDYVEGQSLVQRVGQHPLPANQAARYVALIAEAIHYAHERGILHRDLKPSNVLIDAHDRPRITDFGLAKRLDGESSLTLTGQVLGSPNFMPPEQAGAKHGKVGRPSDVYALGGILYHLLTARAPFQAESLEQLISQVLNVEPVSPRLLNPAIPKDLETIILKCLEKEPSRRYQTAQELADELGRFLRGEPILARPTTPPERLWRWGRRKPVLASLIVLLHIVGAVGLTGILWQWRRAEQQTLVTQHHLYVANMNVVQHRWEQNLVSRVRELLGKTATATERGFEWYYWQRQMHLELTLLRGHTGPLLAVAYSPDGERIVTGSADHTARVWDAASGQHLLTLRGHSESVKSVAFSPDGQRILTGSWDGTAMVWDATNGSNPLILKGHDAAVFSVAFSPSGQRIVTGSHDGTARVWDAVTGTSLLTFSGHTDRVWAVAFSPDGQRIVSGGWDQTAKVWDADSGHEHRTLVGHSGAVLSVAFSPDGQRIVTGSQDHQVKVWNATDGAVLHTLRGHGASVFSVGFSPDGKWIISGSGDQTARVWDAASGEELRSLKGHGSQIGSVALSPDGQRIVTGGGAVRFSADGRFVDPNIEEDPTAKVWDAGGGRGVLTLEGHTGAVCSVDFSTNGQLVVSGSFDGTARVWDVRTGQCISSVRGHGAPIRAVAFLPDGKRFVTGSFDRTASVWDVASGNELHKLEGHTAEVFCVAVSPDGRRIATGSWDGRVKLWDAATGALLLTSRDHRGKVYSVAFSSVGQRMVSASGDEAVNVNVWEANSGKALFTFQPTAKIWSAAFSRDGRRIVTGTHDLTARVWDAASGHEQLTLTGHTEHIPAAVFSPDGRRIVTNSADQTAKLWDAATGEELVTFKGHSGWVFSVAFSQDGQRIATGSGDHTIKVWEAASKEQVAKWQEEERTAAAGKEAPANPR
ncbi:MAG: protein kinase [Verrucomicrobiae bacterium]|nr:protein kinase [Verrucomicrobiae bacterium]